MTPRLGCSLWPGKVMFAAGLTASLRDFQSRSPAKASLAAQPATDRCWPLWADCRPRTGTSVLPEERGGLSDGNSSGCGCLLWTALDPGVINDHCSERSPMAQSCPNSSEISSFVPKAMLNTISILSCTELSSASAGWSPASSSKWFLSPRTRRQYPRSPIPKFERTGVPGQ
jgi:hypothetical protein